ncbi:MAG TPA: hypothetical protein PLU80_13440 [Acidobacteriota bacterium]|nr:hypothetical protein [Acidobacteriota bacterium]
MAVLFGNIYPTSLVRRSTLMTPISISDARQLLETGFTSYWGHSNTARAASELLGIDVIPSTDRPAVTLDPDTKLPTLNGCSFNQVVVLSPEYRSGFRPQPGVEVEAGDILGWQCLLVTFPDKSEKL